MGKSRIFLIGLILFLVGIALEKVFAVSPPIGLTAIGLVLFVLIIFGKRALATVGFWAIMLIFGLSYPDLLAKEQLVSLGPHHPLIELFAKSREAFLDALSKIFPEPYGAFAQGLSVGARSQLPGQLKQAFIDTGTIHIIAVSGQNFTIVLKLFAQWTQGLGRKFSFVLGTVAILGFVFLIGGQSSVVRAAIMGWLFLLASFLGRLPNITVALFLTAAIMVAFEPRILTESLNFQLSVLSMLGLIAIEPRLKNYLESAGWQRLVPKFFRDGLTATIAAQLATLGLILGVFGRVSLVAPLANMMIAPLVPFAMIGSLITGAVAMISDTLGQLLTYPTWLILKAVLEIIEFFSQFNVASLKFEPWSWWWVVSYYAIVAVLIWMIQKRKFYEA